MLVVAAGAIATEPLPGAITFRGRRDVDAMRDVLARLTTGDVRSVVFALARSMTWPLPLYELALMLGREIEDRRLTIVTPEPEPIDLFGPVGSRAMRELLAERGVELRCGARPARVTRDGLVLGDAALVPADRVITIPVLRGPGLPGLPSDPNGFLPVDRHGHVRGVVDVYAAGDVTAFPLKQGGIAAQQADAVAAAIAARAGALVDPAPFRPVIRGLLLTGAEPIYLRAEPIAATDGPAATAATRVRLGSSVGSDRPLWWPPAKVAGHYLGPYLATARPRFLTTATLADRPAPVDRDQALELALLRADAQYEREHTDSGDAANAVR